MNRIAKSQGFTFIGFICMSVLLIIVVLIAFRVTPAYIENYSIVDSLKTLQSKLDERAGENDFQKRTIKKALGRLFDVNGIRSVNTREVEVSRFEDGYKVRVNYDVNVDLVGNVSLILHFDDSVVVKKHES